MAIFLKNNNWYVDYYEGNGKRVRKMVGPKKTDAKAYLGKMEAAKRENKLFDVKKEYNYTFEELLEKYIETCREQKYFRDKKYYIPALKSAFDGRLLSEIGPYDLEKFKNERKKTPVKNAVEKIPAGRNIRDNTVKLPKQRSNADVNRILSTLRHMFSKAVEWEMVEKSPFSKVKRLFYKENNNRLRFLTEYEEERLLFYCKDHIRPIVITALNTGMRRGEILSLTWPQVRNGFIYLHKTKTNEARQIPINNTLRSLFNSIPRHIKSEYVFCDSEGKPYKDIKRSFNTTLRKANIEDFRFHDLRHTFASQLVMRGASLKDVQEFLGHKNISMTMRYAHLSQAHKKAAICLLDDNFDESSQRMDNMKQQK